MKPRVLHFVDSFHQGGTESQAVQLTRLLHGSGRYEVHVGCLDGRGVLRPAVERLGIGPIHEFPLVSFHHPTTARQLAKLRATLRALKIDIVHAHDFYTNIFGMAGATLARVPVRIASRRETDPGRSRAQRWVERRAFDAAHAIVVNADAIRRDLVDHGVSSRKIHTIHNGVDVDRFSPGAPERRVEALQAFGIESNRHRFFVTIVANLRLALKDHPTFLRAARRVKDSVPSAGFIIAGEGELLESIRLLAAELGLERDVFFTGRCERVADLLSASDVCVLSSRTEGFANVIVEYMAAGHPVVATDVGGAREAVTEGVTGHLVAPGDADAMADRIVALLDDDARRLAMGARGRAVALDRFSCLAQLARTEVLYESLLSQVSAVRAGAEPARVAARG